MKALLIIFIFLFNLFNWGILSQVEISQNYQLNSRQQQKNAMYILGGWSLVNITSGAIGFYTQEGESRYFHQMNAGWNIVNLGLAGIGLFQLNREQQGFSNAYELIQNQQGLEKVFLVNGALNFAYMTSGVALRSYAFRDLDNYHRWTGFGNSLILQGGFLAVFDFANYFIHRKRAKTYLHPYLKDIRILPTANGIGMTYQLN
jgi:hypothetical protein